MDLSERLEVTTEIEQCGGAMYTLYDWESKNEVLAIDSEDWSVYPIVSNPRNDTNIALHVDTT